MIIDPSPAKCFEVVAVDPGFIARRIPGCERT
jgi:hypothetical protein